MRNSSSRTLRRSTGLFGKLALALTLVLVGCEGPMGPEGPPGPQGETGAEGPPGADGTNAEVRVRTSTVNSNGEALVFFPGITVSEASVNCWLAETSSGPFVKVAFTNEGTACGAMNQNGGLSVAIVGGNPGYLFLVTAAG